MPCFALSEGEDKADLVRARIAGLSRIARGFLLRIWAFSNPSNAGS